MKQIILIAILLFGALCSFGQTTNMSNVNIIQTVQHVSLIPYKLVAGKLTKSTTPDTLSAADTTYLYRASSGTFDFQIPLVWTKVSGYVRGTATLQGTYDTTGDYAGTSKWFNMSGTTTYCTGCSSSTFSLANASATTEWLLPKNEMNFYRIQCINDTSATGKSTPTALLYFKK